MNSIRNTANTSDGLDSWASSDIGEVIDELDFKLLPWNPSGYSLVNSTTLSQCDYLAATHFLFKT